jgi:hypothetical protein
MKGQKYGTGLVKEIGESGSQKDDEDSHNSCNGGSTESTLLFLG